MNNKRDKKTGQYQERHGYDGTSIYKSWISAKARCNNPRDAGYKNYGGRGIKMCDQWVHSFENFLEDMGDRFEGLTLERIDVNGDYCPENCRWATQKEQARNRRTNVFIEYSGQRLTCSQWAEKLGINKQTISERIKRGWPVEKVLMPVVV